MVCTVVLSCQPCYPKPPTQSSSQTFTCLLSTTKYLLKNLKNHFKTKGLKDDIVPRLLKTQDTAWLFGRFCTINWRSSFLNAKLCHDDMQWLLEGPCCLCLLINYIPKSIVKKDFKSVFLNYWLVVINCDWTNKEFPLTDERLWWHPYTAGYFWKIWSTIKDLKQN